MESRADAINADHADAAVTVPRQEPVRVIERDGVRYTLLGTAHVSRASAEEVRRRLADSGHDAVALELCESRHRALTDPDRWQQIDLFQIIREGKAGIVAANLALGAYQRRIAEQFGIEPGAEMRAALETAREQGVPVSLVDRDVGITLRRLYRAVPFWHRLGLLGGLVGSLLSREEITEEDIERLKEGDILESTFTEFAERSQPLYDTLIAERDRYMAARLRQDSAEHGHRNLLAVVGAGHLRGLSEQLQFDTADPAEVVAELDASPKKARWPRLIPWAVVALVLAGFVIGFQRSPELGLELVITWVMINGVLSALGAALAAAHPLTVISAFVAAPLTSLNPTVGAGMVTAAVELWLRRPQVADFSGLRDQLTRLRGWWRNRVARTLLVFFLSSVGSAVGTYLAGFRILERLV